MSRISGSKHSTWCRMNWSSAAICGRTRSNNSLKSPDGRDEEEEFARPAIHQEVGSFPEMANKYCRGLPPVERPIGLTGAHYRTSRPRSCSVNKRPAEESAGLENNR